MYISLDGAGMLRSSNLPSSKYEFEGGELCVVLEDLEDLEDSDDARLDKSALGKRGL